MRVTEAVPTYGQPVPTPEPTRPAAPPPRTDPLTARMRAAVGDAADAGAANRVAALLADVVRMRTGDPARFVAALATFRRVAVREGVVVADLPRLERAALFAHRN